jgi:predicted aspartyl protease
MGVASLTAGTVTTTAPMQPPGPQANPGAEPSGPQRTELAQPIAVPLSVLDHQLAVEASVEGSGPYQFAVDTGFPGVLQISPQLAQALDLPATGTIQAGDPSGEGTKEVPLVQMQTVEIGGATFSGIEASVAASLSELAPDGVIGLALFAGLTATLDYPNQELRLSREALPRNGEHVLPFATERDVPQVKVYAAGVTLLADVDTGGPSTLTVPSDTELPFHNEPEVVRQRRTTNSRFDVRAATLAGELRLAGWSVPNPIVEVVEGLPVASVGAALLRDYVLTFDLVNKRLALTQ